MIEKDLLLLLEQEELDENFAKRALAALGTSIALAGSPSVDAAPQKKIPTVKIQKQVDAAPREKIPTVKIQKQREAEFEPWVEQMAEKYRIDKNLIKAVIATESNWRPDAKSVVGAEGLMQLMPKTAKWLGVSKSSDPKQNIEGGAKYLAWLQKYLNKKGLGNIENVIAAYNAGQGNVVKHKGIPPFSETQKYVAGVMRRKAAYDRSKDQLQENLTQSEDGWEILDDPRAKVTSVRKYSDGEYGEETDEYFKNERTRNIAPNAFKNKDDMIQKMKSASLKYLSSEEMQNINNSDVGDILDASKDGGKEGMIELAKVKAREYGKDWDRLEKGIASNSPVPAPMVLKDKRGSLYLLAGNTRLMSFTAHGKKLPVKIIDYNGVFMFNEDKINGGKAAYDRSKDQLQEKKKKKKKKKKKAGDRCTRIAKRKYDTWPSAYASGAVVQCRKGKIWKGLKEDQIVNSDEEKKQVKVKVVISEKKKKAKTDYSKEKKSGLHGWFSRQGGKGKSKGWVDCNTCRKDKKTGRKKCKSCGRKEGEKRSKYPSCRPTPSACGTPGKGKKWGKKSKKGIKEMSISLDRLTAIIKEELKDKKQDRCKDYNVQINQLKQALEKAEKASDKNPKDKNLKDLKDKLGKAIKNIKLICGTDAEKVATATGGYTPSQLPVKLPPGKNFVITPGPDNRQFASIRESTTLSQDRLDKIIKEEIENILSEGMKFHLLHEIPLSENIYRPGSSKFFSLFNEARALSRLGVYKLNEEEREMIEETDIGQFGIYEGKKVPLDFPMRIEEKKKNPPLNKPSRNTGGGKKYKVFVRNSKTGNVKKVTFGDKKGGLTGNWNDPKARKAFSDRHNCPEKKDKTKPGYWSCRAHKYFGKNVPGRFW